MKFSTEAELCKSFISILPEEYTAYPETAGFDMLLVRKPDGYQIGIEAKLKLNAKVISQIAERIGNFFTTSPAPDSRAILVPRGGGRELKEVCSLLGIAIIEMPHPHSLDYYTWSNPHNMGLPLSWHSEYAGRRISKSYFDFCPAQRIAVPDYIPDTDCGTPSPVMLTEWKVKAIKLSILHDKTGFVTRQDFRDLDLSISRFIQYGLNAWMLQGKERGQWVKSARFPDLSKQHPVNYVAIEADFNVWNPRKERDEA